MVESMSLFTYHVFSANDYAKMVETGILTDRDRVELIDGEIRSMSPIGPYHAAVVTKLVRLLNSLASQRALISPQNPIHLNDFTEPQPDIAILHPRADYYAQAHPTADDVLVVIEVSDTSARYDREEKIPRYARAGIPEAWIIDLVQLHIEQYYLPRSGHYTHIVRILPGETLSSQILPEVHFNSSEVF